MRLHIANGPTLYLHPEHAAELLRAQVGGEPETSRGAASPDANECVVPAQLGWRGLQSSPAAPGVRGGVKDLGGDVVVDGIDIIKGVVIDKAAKLAGAAIVKKVDGQVDPGVYALQKESLQPLKGSGATTTTIAKGADGPNGTQPALVLIHGTFSNTAGTFSKLWQSHPDLVARLFSVYGNRVYGLEHHTLGDNPFANALLLAKAAAPDTTLHLLTHSRGGLVAEALTRVCAGLGTATEDLALFAKAGFAEYKQDLEALAAEVRRKNLRVTRVVRVACPVRGTLLASRRLDAFLSVFKWGLATAGIPVLPQLVEFIGEVARRRAKPEELPGLEVQMPGSSFTKWANTPGQPIDSDLRVIAGDVQGDSVLSWLKTLLTDAFYWTDHDLVVQTRSMYGGSPRGTDRAKFILDRGAKVNHFNYFTNDRTANLITRALVEDAVDQFLPIGPLSWAGEDSSGVRAAMPATARRTHAPDRPAVFVLPGILGSHLQVDGKRIWLSLRFINNLDRLKWNAKTAVKPDGPVGSSYDKLINHLGATHEVIPFSYDWRGPLEKAASDLAIEIDAAIAARKGTNLPVQIVAHSMGGLVVRTMQLEANATWQRFMSQPGARFLMLGTPNGGSFAPMQVMSGDDTFGNLFTMFGSLFEGVKARQLVAGMPGLLQLQAQLIGGKRDLGDEKVWTELATADLKEVKRRIDIGAFWHKEQEQVAVLEWGIPLQRDLDLAIQLRKRLDAQLAAFGNDTANMALVVGKAKSTPAGIDIVGDDVVYLDTSAGDGRVTLENARVPGVRTWQVDAVHGDLANERDAFAAYVEILATGKTDRLPVVDVTASTRSAATGAAADPAAPALTPSRPSRALRASAPPPSLGDALVDQPETPELETTAGIRFSVAVTNGNLKFVREPLMVGHYTSVLLTGAESAIDYLIGGSMSQSLKARLYPTNIGSSQIFTNLNTDPGNPYAMPRPEAVLVVGLGDEGELQSSKLIETVRQGVIAYAQRVVERADGAPATFEIASTLIGSGGINQSAGASAQAIAVGVRQANLMLAEVGWPIVSRLRLIELYLDRAADALNALRALSATTGKDVVVEPYIEEGQGGLLRPPDFGYRGADYDMVSVYEKRVVDSVEHTPDPSGSGEMQATVRQSTVLEFELSTSRAREEVRGSVAQSKLVDNLVETGADVSNNDPRIGRTLFKLLVPLEIEPFMASATSLQLKLDSKTAAYPWEMLDLQRDERAADVRPWGIQTRLLRKLRTSDFRESPRPAAGGVLVIGEPQCSPDKYPPLPGAAAEASEVARELGAVPLLNGDAMAITKAVFDRSYSILHVAGHGDIIDGVGGIVLSNNITFGAREIKAMRIVPDLAFINCCHLGRFPTDPTKRRPRLPNGLPAFAANVAEELIKIGVRCVVAAGWAVDDDAAMIFARTFYKHIKGGRRFADAVAIAREVTYTQRPQSNTWAAYQCYGEENWTFGPAQDDVPTSSAATSATSEFGLMLRLRKVIVDHQYSGMSDDAVRTTLTNLQENCDPAWLARGAVAAAFGEAYGEIGAFADAIRWYTVARDAEDGGSGLRALEQLGNLQARLGEKIWRADPKDRERALAAVEAGIEQLEKLAAIGLTAERGALLGSAYKRRAEILGETKSGNDDLATAMGYYKEAEDLARKTGGNVFYPGLNCLSLDLRLRGRLGKSAGGFDEKRIDAIRLSLGAKNKSAPDFWSVVGSTELRIYEALAAGTLADFVEDAVKELLDVQKRARSRRQWDSVALQTRITLRDFVKVDGLSKREADAVKKLLELMPEKEADAGAGPDPESPRAARPGRKSGKRPAKRPK
ncbi:MAG TPA: CHAT domain-containing protein [Steroidobacteraceae bacterium]|nr:CHAT domain-containing protein [Steroidobacteraceae bacterium]